MRRFRYWLTGLLCLTALAGASVAFYFKFIDTSYSGAEFHTDTGIVVTPTEPGVIARAAFTEKRGRVTLCLFRGEPHGIITTSHGWRESLWVEIPWPSTDEQIELNRSDVRLAFGANDGRSFGEVGDGGVRGYLRIESVSEGRIVATHDVTVDACYRQPYNPCFKHEEVVFRGRSTFRLRPRPEGERLADVWPRPVLVNPKK